MRLQKCFKYGIINCIWVISVFFAGKSQAQNISNEGTDFWVCFPSHVPAFDLNDNPRYATMSVFITSKSNSTGKVICGNSVQKFSVQANTVTEVLVPRNNSYIPEGRGISTNRGIRITVDAGQPKVVAYAHVFAGARSAASLVIPVEALGQKYYAISYTQWPTGFYQNFLYRSQFNIVAVENNTVVKITPVNDGVRGFTFSITLANAGDVYQYQSEKDVSGSFIEVDEAVSPCKKIAVFSGSSALLINSEGCIPDTENLSIDPLFQQLYPIESWGKTFALVPFYDRLAGSIYRFMAGEDNTKITYKGTSIVLNKAGDYFTTAPLYEISMIESDKPITVTQYALTQYCSDVRNRLLNGSVPGDPDMVILNPVEYSIDAITLYSSTKLDISEQYVNVAIPTSKTHTFTINNVNYGDRFIPIPDYTSVSYAQINLKEIGGANFSLAADTGFNAIAYGFGHFESYAYSAGTSLASEKMVSVLKQGSDIPVRDACVNDAFDFKLVLPYQADRIIWKLEPQDPDIVINSPQSKSIKSGGKTLYEYKLAANKTFSNSGVKDIVIKALPPTSANVCNVVSDEVINHSFQVFDLPLADFSVSGLVCPYVPVKFDYLEQHIGRTVTDWQWDFGDGTISTEKNPEHIYTQPGTYKVKLVLKSEIGCESDVKEKDIEVTNLFTANWSATAPVCRDSSIQFNDLSVYHDPSAIYSWLWDFGDNTTSTLQHPVHTYANSGTYSVSLTVSNETGCKEIFQQDIKINKPPVVNFNIPEVCTNDIAVFKAQVIEGNVTSWIWDFGDGTNDLSEKYKKEPKHQYAVAGDYTVTLRAVTPEGCSVVLTKPIVVSSPDPAVNFEVLDDNSLCEGNAVYFKNNTTIAHGSIKKLEWIFDYDNGQQISLVDDSPVHGKIYTHKYPQSGQNKVYKVVLRAYSGETCYRETTPVNVYVNGQPSLYFTVDKPICVETKPFRFNAGNLNTAISGTLKFEGMGMTGDIFHPSVAGAGVHEITLSFLSDKGCADTLKYHVQVEEKPELNPYEEYHILFAGETQFDLQLTKGSNVKFQWTPSEGLSADDILNPVAAPKKTTKYTLQMKTADDCVVFYDVQVNVHLEPFIPNAFSPNGDGYNDTWSIKYLESFVNADIRIFNRYGQEVFYSKRYTDAWDGKYKGVNVPAGVYYYIIEPNNGQNKFTGSITLLR